MNDRAFDIILIGATGFTGRRAARYLKDHAPHSLKWGIGARNKDKLTRLAEELELSTDVCFQVDTTVQEQVEKVVRSARIILSTAGPFSLYGEEVIAACARYGSHYLDITGEVGFIRKMKDKYGDLAKRNQALMVPFSGFDSVPADLITLMLSKSFDTPNTLSVKTYYRVSGGFNGGTIATMMNKFETGEYKKMNDPELLMEQPTEQKIHRPKQAQFFGYDREVHRWTAPFIMGAINSKVVYRSASILHKHQTPYADSISYSEHSALGKWYNPLPFILVSLMLVSLKVLGPFAWFRKLLMKMMPAPGEGPSEKEIENGFIKLTCIAESDTGEKRRAEMYYAGDAGNKSTVLFLCESAFCLALQQDQVHGKVGFMTPATAFGEHLLSRLTERGLHFQLHSE